MRKWVQMDEGIILDISTLANPRLPLKQLGVKLNLEYINKKVNLDKRLRLW